MQHLSRQSSAASTSASSRQVLLLPSHSWTARCTLSASCSRRGRLRCMASAEPGEAPWYDNLNRKTGLRGPEPPESQTPQGPQNYEGMGKDALGEQGYKDWETFRRQERQEVWDNMRAVAEERYKQGEMPDWFDPNVLRVEESPINQYWREEGLSPYQSDDKWLANFGGNGNSGKGGRGGRGWWREDDPYWPLRDWGDHSMRWWTFGFAAILAAGGFLSFLLTGYHETLQIGFGAGALLSICAMAMSDMGHNGVGHAGVKGAFAICALLALKEYFWGWQHKHARKARSSKLEACGLVSVAMCISYLCTDMSGLADISLPTNPGAVFKSPSVAVKNQVWQRWGYAGEMMKS